MQTQRKFSAATAVLFGILASAASAQEAVPAQPASNNAEQPFVLAPFEVRANANPGYGSSTVTGATRTNTRLIDLPQSISVINDRFLKDIAAFDLDDAFAYTPSVKGRSWDNDGNATIRGFSTDTGSATLSSAAYSYKNGIRLPVGYAVDFANLERIEVVKGPAAAIAGRGSPGGLINYVTKRPEFDQFKGTATLTFGSENFKRGVVDLNAPFGEATGRKGAVRFIGQMTDSDYWREGAGIKSFSAMPSVRAKLNEKVEVIVEGEYNSSERPNDFGMPYNTLDMRWTPFSYSNSEPYAKRTDELYAAWATVNVQATDWLVLRQIFSAVSRDVERQFVWSDSINRATAGDGSGFSPGEIYFKRHLENPKYQSNAVNAQGDAVFTFRSASGKITSQTLFSYEWQRGSYEIKQYNYAVSDLSLSAPIYGRPPTNPTLIADRTEDLDLISYMVSEQLGFWNDRLILSAGWRRDKSDGIERLNRATDVRTQDRASQVAHPRYGLVVKPLPRLSLYGVYSKSSDPITTFFHFPAISPTDSRQELLTLDQSTEMKEAGVKGDFLNGDLIATVSFFQIERIGGTFTTAFGPANDNPVTAGLLETVVSPADESKGVELEVMAVISRKLTLYGSYQRTQTRRLLNNAFVQFRGNPSWTASLFAKYDLRGSSRAGFLVHGGVITQGDQQGDNANTFKISSETRFDAGVDYLWGDWSFTATVNNITNAIVPTQFAAFRANSVLPPRQIRFSASRSW